MPTSSKNGAGSSGKKVPYPEAKPLASYPWRVVRSVQIPRFHYTGTIPFKLNSMQKLFTATSPPVVRPPVILQQFPYFSLSKKKESESHTVTPHGWRAARHHVGEFIRLSISPTYPSPLPAHLFLLQSRRKEGLAGPGLPPRTHAAACGLRLRSRYSSVNKKVHASPPFRFLIFSAHPREKQQQWSVSRSWIRLINHTPPGVGRWAAGSLWCALHVSQLSPRVCFFKH
jgi:hypothetical protein